MKEEKKYAIVYKENNRYYMGETWDRLHEDFAPAWTKEGDIEEALKYESREKAQREIDMFHFVFYGCEVVEAI